MPSTPTPTDLPTLDLPLASSAWMEPELLSSPAPWAGHIPFAAWLMAATRPRTLVELGVYSGISYLAFCQAAVQHGVPLRAVGVDTWAGDPHAGYYGQRILDTLRAQHDARYGHFSTLLQKTFDEALADVPDGSVDLLHIDGLHTYEAVRHDFETWQRKLSPRAVVLFHDIEVRRDDFGVWRFWAEVTQRYPSLAFAHSNGLGVLLVGPDAPAALKALVQESDRWPQRRDAFAALGARFELRARCMHLDTVVADLSAEKTALAHAQTALQGKSQAQHQWIEQQDERLREAQRQQQRDAQAIEQLKKDLAQTQKDLSQSQQDLAQAQSGWQKASAEVQDMLASRSWRVTAGLRWAGRQARKARASRTGAALSMNLKRTRNALRYLLSGNWRALVQRMRHAKQQAVEVQRLGRFDGQRAQSLQCGVLATPHTWYVAHALQAALARAGIPVQLVSESPEGDYPLDLYFVVCPQMFQQLPPGEKRVAFQMEQTVSSRWFTPEYLSVLENSLAALDYAQTNLSNLAGYGIVYPHVYLTPIGGIADYPRWLGEPVQADESCDVLFYGDANAPRRRRLLDAVGRRFKLRIVGNLFGADMRRALAGAKVVVNLHYYEGALLETTRLYECLSLGVPVVSECAADQAEHTAMEQAVRFVPVGDEAALITALEQTLQEQANDAGRRAWKARCQAHVAQSQARFEFMLYRMLLARRVIDYPQFAELTASAQPLAPRMALSLPETTARRQAFEQHRPADVQVFDGLRYAPGWIGCALSYKYLAQQALRQGMSQLEIMEDDVDFPPEHTQRRQRVLAHLAQRAGQWDVFVGVMALVHPDTRVLDVEQVDGETYVTLDRMISMVCNIYTRPALERIAAWDETWQDADRNTIDRYLQNQGQMRVLITLPFLVGHREDVASSLWGISNAQYAHLIEEAQNQLQKLVQQFLSNDYQKDSEV